MLNDTMRTVGDDHQSSACNEIVDDFDKDKKKKRRNRRPKSNNNHSSLSAYSSTSELHAEGSEYVANGSGCIDVTQSPGVSILKRDGSINSTSLNVATKPSKNAFISLPTLHINSPVESTEDGIVQNEELDYGRMLSKSHPVPNSCEDRVSKPYSNKNCSLSPQSESIDQRKLFASHWSMEVTNKALEKGDVFRASFRVNALNKSEAYCNIDGVPTDILINDVPAQNRAVEGDTVAVEVYHPSLWAQMRGFTGQPNSKSAEDPILLPEDNENEGDALKGKGKVDGQYKELHNGQFLVSAEGSSNCSSHGNGHISSNPDHVPVAPLSEQHNGYLDAVSKLCADLTSFPWKRPTGRIVSIIERSPRRDVIVGFLGIKQWLYYRKAYEKETKKNKNASMLSVSEYVQLTPNNPKYPKMLVTVRNLPDNIKNRMEEGDATVEMELVGAQIDSWAEGSYIPQAHVTHIFGRGGELEPNIAAILFENTIHDCEFSSKALSCLPRLPWEVPTDEMTTRTDLRNMCIFTIDPSTATDLDDALSVTPLSNGIVRIGVHIADASYFVIPGSDLDVEAQLRSTSVYLLQRKIPMLPPLLSENIGSLNPGVDRLAFSMFWDINVEGHVVDRWIGRTIIRSCCKLSYEHAQEIIDGRFELDGVKTSVKEYPQLHGQYEWPDVIRCIEILHETSKMLKEKRFNNGALRLESPKLAFLFDENGSVNDITLYGSKDSNFLVEEFMLLANITAAEVMSRAFPENALLRMHPEPDLRRLGVLEVLFSKHGFELDTSCSSHLHQSLVLIKEQLKNDSALFDILISYATKPMKRATYFCSGKLKGSESEWGHYALAVPLYTHFTSPLRRYSDIIVHRTLAAVLEAEEMYLKCQRALQKETKEGCAKRCFTGLSFDAGARESDECAEILRASGVKYSVPSIEILAGAAAHCNLKKLATVQVKDACDKLFMWVLLKKKQILFSEARVLGLGPKFMSIYIHSLAIERRIYYDDVEGLKAEWLDSTSTLLLNLSTPKNNHRRNQVGKSKALEEVAFVLSPCDLKPEMEVTEDDPIECDTLQVGDLDMKTHDPDIPKTISTHAKKVHPAVFPLTVPLFATIPVALHAIGGDDGPVDVGVRLFMSSYTR